MKFKVRSNFISWEFYFLLFSMVTAVESVAMGGLSWTPEFPAFNIGYPYFLWLVSLLTRLLAPLIFIWFRRLALLMVLISWLLFLALFHGVNAELAQLEPLIAFVLLAAGLKSDDRRRCAILFLALLFFFSGLSKLNGSFLGGEEWRAGEMIYPAMSFVRRALTALPNPWTGLAIAGGEISLGILWILSPRRALFFTAGFICFILGTFAGRVTALQIFAVFFAMIFTARWAWKSWVDWLFLLPPFLTFGVEKQHELIYTPVFIIQALAMLFWLRSKARENPQALEPILNRGLSRRVAAIGVALLALPVLFFVNFLPVPYGFSIFSGYELKGHNYLKIGFAERCALMPKNLRHGYRVKIDQGWCCLQVPNESAGRYQENRLGLDEKLYPDLESCLSTYN